MDRVKKLYFRQIVAVLIFSLLVIGSIPAESMAYVVGSNQPEAAAPAQTTRAADMADVQRVLESKIVSGKLKEMGFSMSEIKSRLNKLSDQELHQFASRMNSLAPGGDGGLGIIIALLIIVILVIVILKLTQHRIIVQ